jgi:hypothetical protein
MTQGASSTADPYDNVTSWNHSISTSSNNCSDSNNTRECVAVSCNLPLVERYVIVVLYGIFGVVGGCGNFFVLVVSVWTCLTTSKVHPMFIFVGSLAVSDLGLYLGVTWVNALYVMDPNFSLGFIRYIIYLSWSSLTSYSTIGVLVAIALDR